MTSKQRVFSTDNTINYIEYIKNKQGVENLKTIKYNHNNVMLNKFASYEQFLTLSKSYYKYNGQDYCIKHPTQNLYNSNISYINKNIIHMNNSSKKTDCGCGSKKNAMLTLEEDEYKNTTQKGTKHFNHNECKLLKQVLYPYGHYNTNKQSNMYFPYKLDLDKWCSKKKQCHYPFDYHYNNDDVNDDINDDVTDDNPVKHCKTGLCRNPKPLFI